MIVDIDCTRYGLQRDGTIVDELKYPRLILHALRENSILHNHGIMHRNLLKKPLQTRLKSLDAEN
jgi:hypothetical protein